jgi:hypothetical protein
MEPSDRNAGGASVAPDAEKTAQALSKLPAGMAQFLRGKVSGGGQTG